MNETAFAREVNLDEMDTVRVSKKAIQRIMDWRVRNSELVRRYKYNIPECTVAVEGSGTTYYRVIDEQHTLSVFYGNDGIERATMVMEDRDDFSAGMYCFSYFKMNPEPLKKMQGERGEAFIKEIYMKERFVAETCIAYISCFPSQVAKYKEPIGMSGSTRRKVKRYNRENPETPKRLVRTVYSIS